MDLGLTKTGDYAVRAAISLARMPSGDYRKIREVAEDMELPLGFTPQILALLARSGIAEAKAGRDGGYRLRRHPRDISLLEVVEAAEGPLRSDRCILRGGPCRWEDACPVHEPWTLACDALKRRLVRTSLASIAREDRRKERAPDAARATGGQGA